MKYFMLIIFKKYCLNFSLSYWLIISLQDFSWDRSSDRKFLKWLVFNHKYTGIVKTWEIFKNAGILSFSSCAIISWVRPQYDLMKLRVLLNRANRWNFKSEKRNLDMLVVIKNVCGHVKPLVLLRPFDYFCWRQKGSPLFT